jgi:hypothetical protein
MDIRRKQQNSFIGPHTSSEVNVIGGIAVRQIAILIVLWAVAGMIRDCISRKEELL